MRGPQLDEDLFQKEKIKNNQLFFFVFFNVKDF